MDWNKGMQYKWVLCEWRLIFWDWTLFSSFLSAWRTLPGVGTRFRAKQPEFIAAILPSRVWVRTGLRNVKKHWACEFIDSAGPTVAASCPRRLHSSSARPGICLSKDDKMGTFHLRMRFSYSSKWTSESSPFYRLRASMWVSVFFYDDLDMYVDNCRFGSWESFGLWSLRLNLAMLRMLHLALAYRLMFFLLDVFASAGFNRIYMHFFYFFPLSSYLFWLHVWCRLCLVFEFVYLQQF